MKTTNALKNIATHGGPMVFGAGAAMLAAALVTSGHGQPEAVARPTPSAVPSHNAAALLGEGGLLAYLLEMSSLSLVVVSGQWPAPRIGMNPQ